MGKTTEISWCDSTFNPWIGCTKVSPACTNCYAETLMHRWGKDLWGKGQPRQRTSAANWKQPLAWEKQAAATGIRRKVFCGSLCDWLDAEVPIEWLADLLDLIRQTPNLDWLLLTKRPELWGERICGATGYWGYEGQIGHCGATDAWAFGFDWLHFRFPANVWIGCTVENQEMADKRIPELLKIPALVRFLSCEPLLGPIQFLPNGAFTEKQQFPVGFETWTEEKRNTWFMRTARATYMSRIDSGIDWVICGGESGQKARPMDPDWARVMLGQCKMAGVPFFFKQWGEWLHDDQMSDATSIEILDPSEWPRYAHCYFGGGVNDVAYMIGKARAGHLLDAVEHHEFPNAIKLEK